MKKYILILIVAFFCWSNIHGQKILYVGNSLTYTYDIPGIVKEIGEDLNLSIDSKPICYPNYSLEDHWKAGNFQIIMMIDSFDYVIVQQGPSSQPAGKEVLVDYGMKIDSICKLEKARLSYYMVWPSRKYYQTFDGVIANYTEAARLTKSLLIPVGEIRKKLESESFEENLYGPDNFHPSETGSFLSALTIIKSLYPEIELTKLKFRNYRKWIKSKSSFHTIINTISSYF